jgi:para-aminobenzoate synthetase/4-amino-4-deoxychorismate lyase
VFETVLIAAGRPVALERHLARLSRSVAALYDRRLPAGVAEHLREAARDADRARMRVEFRPDAGIELELTRIAERRIPVRLVPTTLPGGLGAHKWIDRRLLEAVSHEGEPLLCDLDGFVLESARGNVFGVDQKGRLLTAPADGRILPGVTRARVLKLATELGIEVQVQPLALGRLEQMREVFVTGALGGVEAAQLEDRPSGVSTLTARLAEALAGLEPPGGKVLDLLVHGSTASRE